MPRNFEQLKAIFTGHHNVRNNECRTQFLQFFPGFCTIIGQLDIPVSANVKAIFEEKEPGSPNQLVFKDTKGGKIKRISNAFGKTVEELGLNAGVEDRRMKVTFHSLRHTYASWLVQNGEDLYTVKKLLGHSTITMTERYSHLGADTLRKAVKKLESSFKKTPKNNLVSLETAALGITTA